LESAIVMAANQGVGIARLPYYTVARQLKQGRLKAIFSGAAESDRMVKVFYPRSKFVPRTTHAFIDFLERRLKQTRAPKRNGHEP
jgi:DNA-binding transcriptional LysR family regulator